MTAHDDMAAAGARVLDLLTVSEAAAQITAATGVRCSADRVRALAKAGELVQVKMGTLARFTPESVAAYIERQAEAAKAS